MSNDNHEEFNRAVRNLHGGRVPSAPDEVRTFPLSRRKGAAASSEVGKSRDPLPWSPRAHRIGRGILIGAGVVVAGAAAATAIYVGGKATEHSNDTTIDHSQETVLGLSEEIQEHPEDFSRLVISDDMPAVPAVMEALAVPDENHDAVEQLLTAQAISFDHTKPGHENNVDGQLYQGETLYFPTADVPNPNVNIYSVNVDALSSQVGALPQNNQ